MLKSLLALIFPALLLATLDALAKEPVSPISFAQLAPGERLKISRCPLFKGCTVFEFHRDADSPLIASVSLVHPRSTARREPTPIGETALNTDQMRGLDNLLQSYRRGCRHDPFQIDVFLQSNAGSLSVGSQFKEVFGFVSPARDDENGADRHCGDSSITRLETVEALARSRK